MFSGIVAQLGTVKRLTQTSPIATLQVSAGQLALRAKPGESIAVNGVCLTVVAVEQQLLTFEVMQETLKRTNLGLLSSSDQVNLEPALRLEGSLDGHLVSGHIDASGSIKKISRRPQDLALEISCSSSILRYIVLKGSVTLDGVNLTVSALTEHSFTVNLIPYTINNTTLGNKKQGDYLNIEVDILAKYVERFLAQNHPSAGAKISSSFLQKHGFAS